MIKRFLRAGVIDEGIFQASEMGTPQGGIISPILANIYLHYALDLWFKEEVQPRSRGKAHQIRYADDFVACFQMEVDAREYKQVMEERLKQYGLEIEPTKTKIIAFGPLAEIQARRAGKKPDTFDFLGFTHYVSKTRTGRKFRMKRITARKKQKAKLAAFKEWVKSARTWKLPEIMNTARRKIQGHYAYYGVTDNSLGIGRFSYEAEQLLYKWLNRRGKPKAMTWKIFRKIATKYNLPSPRIRVNLLPAT